MKPFAPSDGGKERTARADVTVTKLSTARIMPSKMAMTYDLLCT